MRTHQWIGTLFALGLGLTAGVGCETMEDNPRTTGTIGGAAAGAALGAAIDRDEPVRGAVIGGAAGGAAGNVGGKIYKDNRD
jgi:phage tail tape-measure protein